VSVDAPVGRALVGHGTGTRGEVEVPCGKLAFEILAIRAPESAPLPRKAA
jgi:transcription elongation GreA/GreB family factor